MKRKSCEYHKGYPEKEEQCFDCVFSEGWNKGQENLIGEIFNKLPLGLFLNDPIKGNLYYSEDYQKGFISALDSIKFILQKYEPKQNPTI